MASIPEASFGMGNIAILDDYLDYINYNTNNPESMKCNKQLRMLPPGTYNIPNINNKILSEYFKIKIGQNEYSDKLVSAAWIEVRLIADNEKSIGSQLKKIITLHFSIGRKSVQVNMQNAAPIDRPLENTDWNELCL